MAMYKMKKASSRGKKGNHSEPERLGFIYGEEGYEEEGSKYASGLSNWRPQGKKRDFDHGSDLETMHRDPKTHAPYSLREGSLANHKGAHGITLATFNKGSEESHNHNKTKMINGSSSKHEESDTIHNQQSDEFEQDMVYDYYSSEDGDSARSKRSKKSQPKQTTMKRSKLSDELQQPKKSKTDANDDPKATQSDTNKERTQPTPHEMQKKVERIAKEKKERKKARAAEKALRKKEKAELKQEAAKAKGRPTKPGHKPYVDPKKAAFEREEIMERLKQQEVDAQPKDHTGTSGVSSGGDDLKEGVDFIQFVPSDDEDSDDEEAGLLRDNRHADSDNRSKAPSAGNKRKRENDYGSDTEGSTGPPPGCPWMGHRQYSRMDSVPRMLTQELKDFVNFLSPSREEHKVREYVHRRIQQIVKRLWNDAQVVIFGSYETRLYLPSSDMDLVLLRSRDFRPEDMTLLASALRKNRVATDITVIRHARVPLVKFKEAISGIPVDISFNITNGIASAQTVNQFMKEVPVLRPLTLLVKHYLQLQDMNEVFRGGIGSYTTLIMILSFLQMHPMIQQEAIDPEDNLGVLLMEFFELYGTCFNYGQVGLRVTDGGEYFDKHREPVGQVNTKSRPYEVLLCSVDPNDASNDTARGSYRLFKVREAFNTAFVTLKRNVIQRRQELFGPPDSSQPKAHIRFDNKNQVPADSVTKSSGIHHNHQVSLLKDVLKIPFEILEHRRHIETVFYEGEYQRIFGDPLGINGLDALERH
ncbi:hypothetical protein BGZ94_003519 [Podila epigama]|nr:hypothetical protein BGZ94_003519 [Podila epigama]